MVLDHRARGDIDGRLAGWSVMVPGLPIVVMVIRKLAGDWLPLGDAAYFAVRSRDVLTANHPLLGAWSSGSKNLEKPVNNLGPLQLDLLAPFTHLLGPEGLAMGIGVLNLAAVVGVWAICRRLIGPVGVLAVMGVTALLEWTMGSRALIEGQQQWALMLPFWCLLFLAWAVSAGRVWGLPWLVFVASLIAQTHLTFALPTGMVVIVAVGGFAMTRWTVSDADVGPEPLLRPMAIAAGVGAVCWAQPLWDQFWGTGNLSRALTTPGDAAGIGGTRGARVVADILGQPPYWLADSITRFDPASRLTNEPSAWLRLAILGAVALGTAVLAVVRPSTHARTMLAMCGPVLLAVAWWAASTIPSTSFGVVPQNYRWIWPIGAFITLSAVSALADVLAGRVAVPRLAMASIMAAGTVLVVVPNLATVYRVDGTSAHDAKAGVVGELRAELSASLSEVGLDDTVVFDRSMDTFGPYGYAVMAELQRQGVAFAFDNQIDGERFGERRRLDIEEASRMRRLYLVAGSNLDRVDDDLVELATASAVTPADDARRNKLDRRFAGALASNELSVDLKGGRAVFGERLDPVVAVVHGDPPQRAGTYEVARVMSGLRDYDLLSGPQELLDAVDEWIVLHRSNAQDRVAIFVDPA